MIRILLWTESFLPGLGGMEWVIHNLGNALAKSGHKVTVLAPRYRRRDIQVTQKYTLVRYGFPFRGSGKLGAQAFGSILEAEHIYRTIGVDVIHVHSLVTQGSCARLFSNLHRGVPVVSTPHGPELQTIPELGYGLRLVPQLAQRIRKNALNSSYVTAVSESMYQLLTEFGVDHARLALVPNGIWWEEFQQKVDRLAVRRAYGLPENGILVISVGRNHPIKGFKYGIEALALLTSRLDNIHYIIVGRDSESLGLIAEKGGIAGHLHLAGLQSLEKVRQLYAASDLFLNTSMVESFGLATLEAMASGLTCVATDVPGNRDLVKPEFGILVPPRNPKALADAIYSILCQSPDSRAMMGHKARQQARAYDWPMVTRLYEQVYKDAIVSLSGV